MQLGMVGLGRMGSNLVRRLLAAGHDCVVFDVDSTQLDKLQAEGAAGTDSLDQLVEKLDKPRAAWVMVPAGQIAEQTVRVRVPETQFARSRCGFVLVDEAAEDVSAPNTVESDDGVCFRRQRFDRRSLVQRAVRSMLVVGP
jgi:3-hydroxyisobutyrate dehydrogenase-like beta-hydroxyacid dehydrogenase